MLQHGTHKGRMDYSESGGIMIVKKKYCDFCGNEIEKPDESFIIPELIMKKDDFQKTLSPVIDYTERKNDMCKACWHRYRVRVLETALRYPEKISVGMIFAIHRELLTFISEDDFDSLGLFLGMDRVDWDGEGHSADEQAGEDFI